MTKFDNIPITFETNTLKKSQTFQRELLHSTDVEKSKVFRNLHILLFIRKKETKKQVNLRPA